jgi:iron complex outermembrane receptor protein
MVKIYITLFFIFLADLTALGQTKPDSTKKDSTRHIAQVMVTGYLSAQPVQSVPASVSVLTPAQLKLQPDNSLVSAMNTVPGVRMEERSPGSYRLSIRGSLLRSPFGIRDIKIYFDDLPLTDAGGNTYLNAIDVNAIQGIEVLKGPDGSLFGANSGGVVLVNPVSRYNDSSFVSASVDGGSYSLYHENVGYQQHGSTNQFNFNQAYETYGGYRQNSSMYRNYFQAVDKWSYAPHDDLKILGFYSDLYYKTPGGLTLAQYEVETQDARLPTATIPGAIEQKIAIGTKMSYGGMVNEVRITPNLRNVFAVYGSYVDFYNPFITNYEQRYEYTYGLRTYFELTGPKTTNYNWLANIGLEWQRTNTDDNNYGNDMGVRDTAQTLDQLHTTQHFIFGRYAADVYKRLHIEGALSLNFYDYKFRNIYPNDETDYTNRPFTPELMPRLALSYQVTGDFAWRASVSRGYSTPTTAEIRPTDNIINTNLQAEYGWNYETGFRLRNDDETMYLDASVFYYILHDAIVMRLNPDETEYYINAGGTHQPGIEVYFTDWLVRQNNDSFLRGVQFNESITLDNFKFSDYHYETDNYSGNQLTGVPHEVFVSSLQFRFPQSLYVFVEHNYTARIPLDDDNENFAAAYNILKAKIGWQHVFGKKSRLDIYGGADNILNEKYSLGDDLNAVGNRFYNAAAPRNYYIGLKVTI